MRMFRKFKTTTDCDFMKKSVWCFQPCISPCCSKYVSRIMIKSNRKYSDTITNAISEVFL